MEERKESKGGKVRRKEGKRKELRTKLKQERRQERKKKKSAVTKCYHCVSFGNRI